MKKDRILVIGGGFFGCRLALYAKRVLGFKEAVVVEEAAAIMQRASYLNQARVHTGYHYPRAFTTAYRSRTSQAAFSAEFAPAIAGEFGKLYAIAAIGSKVTARQFERFCTAIGAPWAPARSEQASLFDRRLVEAVYEVSETAFNASILARLLAEEMRTEGVELRLQTRARFDAAAHRTTARPRVTVEDLTTGRVGVEEADVILSCTYGRAAAVGIPLAAEIRCEITEIAMVRPPPELQDWGVTVMDGPFFSCMPFPALGLHSLSHVRYTPHQHWNSKSCPDDPYAVLAAYAKASSTDLMMRDAGRLLPCIARCEPVHSHFEVKAVLVSRESDDGRPILFEPWKGDPRVVSVLGGKIDNIYDAEAALAEVFE